MKTTTPAKLALLLSVIGLGASFPDAVWARIDPAAALGFAAALQPAEAGGGRLLQRGGPARSRQPEIGASVDPPALSVASSLGLADDEVVAAARRAFGFDADSAASGRTEPAAAETAASGHADPPVAAAAAARTAPPSRVAAAAAELSAADREANALAMVAITDEPRASSAPQPTLPRAPTSPAESAAPPAIVLRQPEEPSTEVEPWAWNTALEADETPLPASDAALRPDPALAGTEAAEPVDDPSPIGAGLLAVSENQLDHVRGGFQTDNGVQISFGIERAVYINGSLVTTTSLNVSDLGKVTTGQPQVSAGGAASGNLALIQNGAGNTFVSGPVSTSTLGTVVQNTLNDQKIQSVTLINATVNSLQILKAQTLQSSLRSAVIDSLRR